MLYCVFDAEADGLLDEVTKIHCFSYSIWRGKTLLKSGTLTDYAAITDFIVNNPEKVEYFVGHNIVDYDIPLFKKILGAEMSTPLIDSLALSYYLAPYSPLHGLEYYGDVYKRPKPVVEDWKNAAIDVYIFRCEEDVAINSLFFHDAFSYLVRLYGDRTRALRICRYLTFKMDCLREQAEAPITIDIQETEKHYKLLEEEFAESTRKLSEVMPKELGKILKSRPAKPFKIDGTLSSHGVKWINFLKENNLPLDTEVVRQAPNPGSVPQIKKWLFSLGWEPITFEENDAGEQVPKVSLPFGGGLCPSVKALISQEPNIELLSMHYKIRHRMNIFKNFLKYQKDGLVIAGALGFTKTLRLAHTSPIVNLPKPSAYYGKYVRSIMKAPSEDYLMCGSDVSSLEDSTKQHYIYFYDPKYVEDMQKPGFDPHLDIGVLAGIIKEVDSELYKKYKKASDEEKSTFNEEMLAVVNQVDKDRGTSKATNFSATYGAGAEKISKTAKIPYEVAVALHTIYWERNKAIKQIAKDCITKVVGGKTWLYNPISGFWIYLTSDKDRFSALNQNSGVYIFDCWLKFVRKAFEPLGIKISMQYHDEIMFYFKRELREEVEEILKKSMQRVNVLLELNVEIKISVDVGSNYAEVH